MDQLPPNAELYLPVLVQEYKAKWPELKTPEVLAGQVEQETCARLTSPRCWNPKTENINPKNNGEYGWGLGQLTNTNRYNNFELLKAQYKDMAPWKWEDRYNPQYQLRALIYMDRAGYTTFKNAATDKDRMSFALSAYNGGLGGVINDRKFCAQTPGCNKEVWFDNVETHSLKSRSKLGGYSISAFQINRDYVRNIWDRAVKYVTEIEKLLGGPAN